MDTAVSAADANRQFSRLLRDVREGRSFVVTSHGEPVARIIPAGRDDAVSAAARKLLLDRLATQPVTMVGHGWSRDDLYDE